ncbi:MAG: hypothetical protein BWK80_16105 [Desulfobacteraceae bacterium IS3]|nr:MAG: hypothetical protein BWK80_16105 [Desulfobacteraceae bacterium IS3]
MPFVRTVIRLIILMNLIEIQSIQTNQTNHSSDSGIQGDRRGLPLRYLCEKTTMILFLFRNYRTTPQGRL